MIRIQEIAFTCYPITNAARARAFYHDVLGLTPGAAFEHDGKHWIEYDVGAGTLALSNMEVEKWKPSADGAMVALEVVDFDAAVAALRAARVRFVVEPMDSGFCRMAIVSDPDGNSVAIHYRKPVGPGGGA